jgi:hypothetical protein
MGITTPGNRTVFLRGKIGNSSGINCVSDPASSSFSGIMGINSISSSSLCINKFFIMFVQVDKINAYLPFS